MNWNPGAARMTWARCERCSVRDSRRGTSAASTSGGARLMSSTSSQRPSVTACPGSAAGERRPHWSRSRECAGVQQGVIYVAEGCTDSSLRGVKDITNAPVLYILVQRHCCTENMPRMHDA